MGGKVVSFGKSRKFSSNPFFVSLQREGASLVVRIAIALVQHTLALFQKSEELSVELLMKRLRAVQQVPLLFFSKNKFFSFVHVVKQGNV